MIRVLHFAATGHGGLATHVLTLATGLDRARFDVRVLCPTGSDLQRRLEQAGIPADHLPFLVDGSFVRELPLVPRIYRYISNGRFDVVHLHSTKAGVWGRLAAAVAGVPVILYTPNGYRFLRYAPGSLSWRVWAGIEWLMGRLGGHVVAAGPSEGQIARDLHLAPAGRTLVINNGVAADPTAVVRAGVRARLGLPEGRQIVLKIGRLAGQKAPLDFVAAAGKVHQRCPDAVFVLIGKGDLEPDVRAAVARAGLADVFHLITWTDEVPALLRETAVFVMTSKHEGLSYAAAEAASAKCGMVLSDVPGLRDLVVDGVTGRKVAPGDVQGFASATIELLERPDLRRQYGEAAALLVAENYSIESMLRQTETLYDRLLRTARGAEHAP